MIKVKPKKSAKPVKKKLTVKAAPKKAVVKKVLVKKASVKKAPIKKAPIKKAPTDIKIPKELVDFAKSFSGKYNKLKCGTYTSKSGKYLIKYLSNLKGQYNGEILNTPYRVGHSTGNMEFSKAKMSKMPPSCIFNAIIWCYVKLQCQMNDYITADIKSIECSIKNGFSKKELVTYYCDVFKNAQIDLNVNRMREINKKFK